MDDHNEQELEFEEPSPEDFIDNEEDIEELSKQKKKRAKVIKITSIVIASMLLFQVFAVFLTTYSIDAIQFIKTSYRLSQQEDIQQYKQAVVTIQGERNKGTGFAISEDGLIVTNHHVIEGQNKITVAFPKGERFDAEVITFDAEIDIAILKVDTEDKFHFELHPIVGNVNDDIIVIGNPLSFTQIANEGQIVSTDDRMLISAPIYRGNSGSPVINSNGQVVGVVYAKRRTSQYGGKSVGVATPIEEVLELLNE